MSEFAPVEILRLLAEADVDFIIVGGVAATLAGSPITTRDLDLVYSTDGENIDRLLGVLQGLDAHYKDPAGRRIVPDASKLAEIKINLLRTRLGDLDLLRHIADSLDYSALVPRSVAYDLDGMVVLAVDLETLIAAKEFADRPKDRYALPFLRTLLAKQHL